MHTPKMNKTMENMTISLPFRTDEYKVFINHSDYKATKTRYIDENKESLFATFEIEELELRFLLLDFKQAAILSFVENTRVS